MFERFTDRTKKVWTLAREHAVRLGHESIGTEHVLLGILDEGTGVAANVLKNRGLDLARMRDEVERLVVRGAGAHDPAALMPLAASAKLLVEQSWEAAGELGHDYVGTEHLLLGLLRQTDGIAGRVLSASGLARPAIAADVREFVGMPDRPDGADDPKA